MVKDVVDAQNAFFTSQKTKSVPFRKQYLKRLKQEIEAREDDICDALHSDFKKPKFEALGTETQIVLAELSMAIKKVARWGRPERVSSSWVHFPSTDWIYSEPYGKVLIIAPWNYPFMLTLVPLVGALAAGNTAVLKPSELSPHTSKVISEIIQKVFPPEYVTVVEGDVEVSKALLAEKWEYIFFTGSTRVGKIIYQSAAEQMTPVTLELGGKTPCIVDETAGIKLAAKRIAWGKFLNAGQTCVAPDYVLVHKKVKDTLVDHLKKNIIKFYGENIKASPDFARISYQKHYEGLKAMLQEQKVLFGGNCDDQERYIEPTLVDEPSMDSALMEDEIFGPILPLISYEKEEDLLQLIGKFPKPLAFYLFSKDKKFQKRVMERYAFGGGTINDVVVQIANKHLPFGGVGHSGIGAYHGKHSFDLFSHKKSLVKRATWLDVPIRYAPYTIPIRWVKKIKHLF
ncbi:aldehyde dehydrogenase family protein [Muricauda sp. JGD-17]|uniref:Aldehyde dehydrogenase n=1 Tax=Flagellimonas ochracea TaxID=2696472 RepID=A0A964WWU9_9FLAO|nr:aldehyde dehydrogenase [Allomuricauda ochracea]NAY90939.1 aldehyde dehydrogenase family protein [Allomuricauda ochracea]